MQRILKFVSRVSILVFLGMLLYVYAFLPEMVDLYIDASGAAAISVDKEVFFYGAIGIFLVINLVTSLFSRMVGMMPVMSKGLLRTSTMKANLLLWCHGLAIILNAFMLFSVTFIGLYYNDEHFNIKYFSFLVYLGPVMLVLWFFVLFYFLLIDSKNSSVNE